MDTIIQKFVSLPPHIKNTLSSPEVIGRLERIEQRHQLSLAEVVMRVAVKDVPVSELEGHLQSLFGVSYEQAKQIKEDLVQNVFSSVGAHLGIKTVGAKLPHMDAQETSLGVDQKDSEIAHHTNRLQFEDKSNTEYDAESLVKKIESTVGKQFDHVLHKRLKRLVESRLVDARSKLEVRSYLVRPEKIGGMGFVEAAADRVLPLIEDEWKKVHDMHLRVKRDEVSPRIAKTRDSGTRPQHPPLAAQHTEPPKPTQTTPAAKQPAPVQTPAAAPVTPPIPKNPPTFQFGKVQSMPQDLETMAKQQTTQKGAPVQAPAAPVSEKPTPPADMSKQMPKMRRNPVVENEATMHDIKRPRKLVGPVEELEQMSIQDFRNLGESLEESANRIQEKIRHLEKESFELRSQGVKGWRKSPLMQEYLAIGRESMEQGKSIKDIIQSRRASGEATMSEGEFETIGSLNHAIRY